MKLAWLQVWVYPHTSSPFYVCGKCGCGQQHLWASRICLLGIILLETCSYLNNSSLVLIYWRLWYQRLQYHEFCFGQPEGARVFSKHVPVWKRLLEDLLRVYDSIYQILVKSFVEGLIIVCVYEYEMNLALWN